MCTRVNTTWSRCYPVVMAEDMLVVSREVWNDGQTRLVAYELTPDGFNRFFYHRNDTTQVSLLMKPELELDERVISVGPWITQGA